MLCRCFYRNMPILTVWYMVAHDMHHSLWGNMVEVAIFAFYGCEDTWWMQKLSHMVVNMVPGNSGIVNRTLHGDWSPLWGISDMFLHFWYLRILTYPYVSIRIHAKNFDFSKNVQISSRKVALTQKKIRMHETVVSEPEICRKKNLV